MSEQEARIALARELAGEAEQLVRDAEAELAAARDPTMADVAETRYREILALQDDILSKAAPIVEARRTDLRDRAIAVAKSARGEVGCDGMLKYRKFMSTAVKAEVIRRYGKSNYLALPWSPDAR